MAIEQPATTFASKMFRTTIWFLVVSLVSFQTMGFSLFDWQTSYAQFQRWPANAKNTTSVSFRFKTNAETGLLLYVDDEGETQYLKLHLRRGFLLMALSDGKEIFNASSKMLVNDLQWHNIVLELTSRRLAYILDGLTVAEHNLSMFTLKSSVYLGGLPHTIDVLLLTHSLVLFEQSFVGCVEDFRYGNASMSDSFPTTLLQSSGISEECKDACKPENPCRNQGACINKFAMAECMCTGTGYRGETCQKELPVVGIPTSHGRFVVDLMSDYVSRLESTTILIRFRSAEADGVFFYTGYQGDYILLELVEGKMTTSVNLGSGRVTIATKNGGYGDNQWHTVKLERFKRSVNLTVDFLDSSTGETLGNFTGFSLPDLQASFFVGGLPDPLLKLKSVSRRNFTGCLQELIFNDYELFSELGTKFGSVQLRGVFTPTCPEVKFSTTPPPESTSGIIKTASGVTASTLDVRGATEKTPGLPSSRQETALRTDSVRHSRMNESVRCNSKNSSCDPVVISSLETEVVTTSPDTTSASGIPLLPCSQNSISCTSFSEPTFTVPSGLASGRTSSDHSQPTLRPTSRTEYKTLLNYSHQDTDPFIAKSQPSLSTSGRDSPSTQPSRPTDTVIMASKNERGEKDLTLWFALAAGIAIVALVLVIAIIVKVNAANRKKYEMKDSRNFRTPVIDAGSFQKSSNDLKHVV